MGLKHDPDRFARIVSEIRSSLRVLEEMGRLPREDFLKNPDKVGNAKYNLIVAIEGCIDRSNHLISRNEWRMPEDYADTFRVLAEEDVLPGPFAKSLGEMARFRNRLVHIYWDIDDERIHRFLGEDIQDIDAFVQRAIAAVGGESEAT